ncbi:uncharacterized protein LOC122368390 [Amphibalanus amphitrite]|uniref:uncharacterized protein LOC122368390 n=1 Tax=Amphibalanus amphitrite TaxID=1232801 RepID=UPI001C8FBE12|nr:uncharacterized protein LOC122368390 [Amphibalanus amphitrite]
MRWSALFPGWLPTPRIWHVADARGWLDIMWQPLSANLHNGETPVISRLPVDRFALEVLHREGSEHVASRGETTGTRWTVARPLWGAAYELLLWVQIAGVQFPWAQYSVRAKLGCPDGQQRCAADGAVFELPDVLLSSWDSANNTLTANWSMTSHGWRVPEFMFSVVVSEAGSGITNQIISSSVTGRDMPNLASDQDYEVFITPVVPELTSPPTFHRKVVLVSTSPAQSAELSKIVEQGGSSSSSVAAVTADVSLRAWPRWAGDIAVQWRPAVLRGDGGDLPASAYRLVVSADGRQLRSDLVDGARTAAVFEWRYTGTVAAGTEYRIHVECSFPTRNFSCGAVTVTPTAPDAATPTDSGWLVLDVPEPAGSWAEASSTCQRRGGHLVAVTSADRQQQLTDLLERRGLSQAWIGLSVCPPFTGAWSDGSRARFEDMGTPPPAAAGECCVKLFRTEDVTSGTVHYQWRMDMCQSVLPPICASRVEGELLNPVENLTARSEYPLSLDLSWQPRSSGWAPSSCLIQVCPTRDLSQRETSLTLPCTNWTSSDGRQAHISGLPGYHEFQVTVWSQLASIQSTEAAYVTARSLSLLPLSVAISRSGLLTAVWQRKVVAGAGDQAADVVLRRMDVAEPPSPSVQALSQALAAAQRAADLEADGAASAVGAATAEPLSRLSTDRARRQPSDNIRWSGLELGARYLLALFDADSNHTTDYVAFSAGPTCMSGEYQLGALCFWPSQEAATYSEALSTCDTSGDARPASASLRARPWVAPIATREEYQLVKNISLVLNKSFWVVQREKRRRRRDLTRRSEPGDVELLPGFKEPPPEPTSDPLAELLSEDLAVNTAEENFTEMDAAAESDVEFSEPTVLKPCTYVQQDRSGIQASTSSCDQEMQAMCSTNITVPEL